MFKTPYFPLTFPSWQKHAVGLEETTTKSPKQMSPNPLIAKNLIFRICSFKHYSGQHCEFYIKTCNQEIHPSEKRNRKGCWEWISVSQLLREAILTGWVTITSLDMAGESPKWLSYSLRTVLVGLCEIWKWLHISYFQKYCIFCISGSQPRSPCLLGYTLLWASPYLAAYSWAPVPSEQPVWLPATKRGQLRSMEFLLLEWKEKIFGAWSFP